MNEIKDDAIMAALGRQMTRAVQKQAVAAGNIANLDTPGYRARELSFGDILDGEIDRSAINKSHERHLSTGGTTEGDLHDTPGLESRRDGNNVQLDHELLTMTRASSDFAAAQAALSAKFRVIRFAIRGE